MSINNEDELTNILRQLQILEIEIPRMFYEMLPLCGFGVAIGFSKFIYLHNRIKKAVFELINAKKKDHIDFLSNKEENSIWQQSIHIENSLIDYNSILDLVYQTLYFRFALFQVIDKKQIKNSADVTRLSEKVKGEEKLRNIRNWLEVNSNTKDFASTLNEYIGSTKRLRDLANDLKHRGSFLVYGLNNPRFTKVTKLIDGENIDITRCIEPPVIHLEEEIQYLIIIHKLTIEMQKKLYSLCDFQGCLNSFLQSAGLNQKG